jgi:hypothetical protein
LHANSFSNYDLTTMKPNFKLLRFGAAIIDGIPAERVDLSDTRQRGKSPHNCKTLACGIGWMGMHPTFNKVGLAFEPGSMGDLTWKGEHMGYTAAAANTFNITWEQARSLFAPRGDSPYDTCIPERCTDKEAFRQRVQHFLDEFEHE